MIAIQIDKLKMGNATSGCLKTNATARTEVKALEEGTVKLNALLDTINDRSRKQAALTGITALKRAARKAMIATTYKVVSGLKSLANATADVELAAQVNFSRSELSRGKEPAVVNRCDALLTLGQAHATALAAKFNVSAADLTAQGAAAVAAFKAVQSKPRENVSVIAAATKELQGLFTEVDALLADEIDPLVETLREVHPAFYHEYQTCRAIVNSRRVSAQPENVDSAAQAIAQSKNQTSPATNPAPELKPA